MIWVFCSIILPPLICLGFVILIGEVALHLGSLRVVFYFNWEVALSKQATIALSSAEAEYRALRQLVAEIVWVVRLLSEFGVASLSPVPVFYDNHSAIHIARNPVFHERTKHIEIDCHFVREKHKSGLIALHAIPTSSQLADIFTKALPRAHHCTFLSKLGLVDHSSLRGCWSPIFT